jgi:hypothetical protein
MYNIWIIFVEVYYHFHTIYLKKSIEMKEKQIVYCSASIESLFVIIFIIKMYLIIFNIIVLISTLILLLHLFE